MHCEVKATIAAKTGVAPVLLATLLAAGCALAVQAQQSSDGQPVPNTFLAARCGANQVQVILESDSGGYSRDQNAMFMKMLAPVVPPAPASASTMFCFPQISKEGAQQFDLYLRQHPAEGALPPPVEPGDRFLIQLGSGRTITATVTGMAGTWGTDGYFLGALATVAPGDLQAYQAATASAFVAVRAGTAPPKSLATVSRSSAAAPTRTAIRELLQAHLAEYAAAARAGLLHLGFHEAPQVPKDQAARLNRLLQGDGTLQTEITRLQLASGEPRYYVRAEWQVDGKATFAVAAWAVVEPEPRILWWDTADSTRCLIGHEIALDAPGSGQRMFPELLNAGTLPDGRTGLVMLGGGYESFSLDLDLYDDTGPQATSVTGYGDGG